MPLRKKTEKGGKTKVIAIRVGDDVERKLQVLCRALGYKKVELIESLIEEEYEHASKKYSRDMNRAKKEFD